MTNKFAFLKPVDIHGVASCLGAGNERCYTAPLVMQKLDLSNYLSQLGLQTHWEKTILVEEEVRKPQDKYITISKICSQLARQVAKSVNNAHWFLTIGGDHSCAIGTWSGAASALKSHGDLGLIWIDAHMDSHTPQTTHSGNIHGMPLASLLGYGTPELTDIMFVGAKIKPENLCLIGIRSYEPEEKQLLEKLGIKIFYEEVVQELGFQTVFAEAVKHVKKSSFKFGISLDIDAIDPADAPGVGTPERDGLAAKELLDAFKKFELCEEFLGFELVELNAYEDKDDKTAWLAIKVIEALFNRVNHERNN